MRAQSFHADVMPPEQASILLDLGGLADEAGYYLAGGTAVALRIGHRRSIDFDWFAREPKVGPEDIAHWLTQRGKTFSVRSQSLNLVDGHIATVRVTFVRYAYPVLQPLEELSGFGCRIASLLDLACMKLAAIAQRGSRKDFLDIYVLLQQGLSLPLLFDEYRRKFQVSDIIPVLRGLVYFDDAAREPMPEMLCALDWQILQRKLSHEATRILERS